MKKGGSSLAIVFGGKPMGKSKGKPMGKPAEDEDEDYEDDEMPPAFEQHAAEAFPELEDDPKRLMALWKAVRACMGAE